MKEQKRDVILRGLICGGEVSLAVADTTQLVNEAIRVHGLSPLAAAALGRTLTAAAYMCSSLKEERGALSVTIKGDGAGGTVCVSGDKKLHMRGYIDNPLADLPPNAAGKLDVGGCVGHSGTLTVVRDDGEGQPFVGTTELVSGEIGEDFAAYYAYSEQLPTAIAVGVKVGREGNYLETSGSAMFSYSFFKGARLGYLDKSFVEPARKALEGMKERYLSEDGSGELHLGGICSVAGLGGNPYRDGTFRYYISEKVVQDDFKGVGPFILACTEAEQIDF